MSRLIAERTRFDLSELGPLFSAQAGRCAYCREPFPLNNPARSPNLRNSRFAIDHRTPTRRGGSRSVANIALACRPCRKAKGTMSEREYLATLHPTSRAVIVRRRGAERIVRPSTGTEVIASMGGSS